MNGPLALPGFKDAMPPFLPGGYLTLMSDGSLMPTSDQSAKTICYYSQNTGNAFPIIRNGTRVAVYFDQPRLVLSSAFAANSIRDVFGVERAGKGHIVAGPAWATATAGSGTRGTGGDTTELARAGGILVNKFGVPGLGDDGSQFILPGEGCYLGSIFMDGTNGQITCHVSYGQSRKWGVWNAYNRKRLYLKAGDATNSWPYNTATIRASNNSSANSLTIFAGLAEEYYELDFVQKGVTTSGNGVVMLAGIGFNSTTVMSGRAGTVGHSDADASQRVDGMMVAGFLQVPSLGIQVVTALETGNGTATSTFHGDEDNMVLSAKWWG